MPSNSLSAKKKVLPRPAICASKQKIFTYDGSDWLIPQNVDVRLVYGGGSGTPPSWLREFNVVAIRQKDCLRWHATWETDGTHYVIRLDYDPVHGLWTYIHSEIDPRGVETSFTQIDIHEIVIPVRHASFTHSFGSPTGLYLDVTLDY